MKSLIFPLLLIVGTVASYAAPDPWPESREQGVRFGAYMDFGETEDDVTLEGIEKFEELAGKRAAIIASSSYWGQQDFPSANLRLIARHGAVPLIFWSPWDKPYEENRGPDRFALDKIASGAWDTYIDAWARSAAKFGKPFFVSFGNEMNGDWFPWSGCFYGREKGGPETFKKAWRHVVSRARAAGASNILWVFHVNAFPAENDVWNTMASYYPGGDFVDWLGVSIYGKQFRAGGWADFSDLLDWPCKELSAVDPSKPLMIAEFGVGDFPKSGNKAKWLSEALGMIPRNPRIKAAVYWHERWQNQDGSFSNLRINSSPGALKAFRRRIADPKWLPGKSPDPITR